MAYSSSADASQADFFGEGILQPVLAPQKTLEQIAAEEEMKRRREEAARLASVPYGTPASQGGTAQGYQVTSVPYSGPKTTTYASNPNDPAAVAAANAKNQARTAAGGSNADSVLSTVKGDYNGTGGEFIPSTGGGLNDQSQLNMDLGNGLADQVLGTDPTVRPDHEVTAANRDKLTPVVDPNLARNDETDRALAMSQDLVDRVLNTPLQTKILADQALSNQLLIARSARGGAGATQNAMDTALGQAPALLQQGAQASIQEQVQRAGAAGQAASIYAGVAGGTADRAVKIAEANQQAGLSVLNNLTQLTGQDYAFDTAKMQAIGQLARDYFNNAQAFANMSTQLQIAQWNDLTARYGIDKNFKAAMEKIAADEGIGPLDALKMALGGAAAIGGIATANPAIAAGGIGLAAS